MLGASRCSVSSALAIVSTMRSGDAYY